MPTLLTLTLIASEPLFFDESWPLEERFLELLKRGGGAPSPGPADRPRPYTLSPLWRRRERGGPRPSTSGPAAYEWRVCLLEERLAEPALAGVTAPGGLELGGVTLAVAGVKMESLSYEALARQSRRQALARPEARRQLSLEFLTPTLLYRQELPLPLPDPVLVFHHYLCLWDTFAPRPLWVNINVLDAIEVHLALTEHRLETRRVRPAGERPQVGFLGQASYKMMAWQKLGAEFLGMLHLLAGFGRFCGTGAFTEQGLGQTRYGRGRKRR